MASTTKQPGEWKVGQVMHRIRNTADKGFTLIELLIVIIILGILAAIVVFAVGTTRKDAVNSACKTDVKSIQLAAEAVKTKSGSYPTNQAAAVATSTTTDGQVLKAWPGGSAAADGVFLLDAKTASGYNLPVDGKNPPTTVLNQDSNDGAVETACTST